MDLYVTMTIQLILEDPRISIPETLEILLWATPLQTLGRIVGLFRRLPTPRAPMNRLDALRLAVLQYDVGGLPITTAIPENEEVGYTLPESDHYR